MLLRRSFLRFNSLEFIQPPHPQPSAMRRVARGVAIGGLAGGLIGMGIEMSPEEMGLRSKTKEWMVKGNQWIDEIVFNKAPESAVPTKIPLSQDLVNQTKLVSPTESIAPSTVSIPDEVKPTLEVPNEEEIKPNEQEEVPDISKVVEPAVEDLTKIEDEVLTNLPIEEEAQVDTSVVPELPQLQDGAKLAKLRSRIRDLELEQARHVGELDAAFETMDRLFSEREEVVGICRHALVVNDLLQSLSVSSLSPGALAVDFADQKDAMIDAAFTGEKMTFVKLLLAKMFTLLYDPTSPLLAESSFTGSRLAAVSLAEQAVKRGDFYEAKSLLRDNKAARDWIGKLDQAILLWQGADIAVGSVHSDLLKILS